MTLPVFYLANTITSVLFPAYSKIQGDPVRMARVYLDSVIIIALGVFPVLALLGIAAPEIIVGLFGSKWAGAVPPFQILCVVGGLRAMTNVGDTLIRSKGRVYLQAVLHAVYALHVLIGSAIGEPWGIVGVSVGVAIAVLIHYVLISQVGLQLTTVNWKSYLGAQVPGAMVAGLVILTVYPVLYCLRAMALPKLVALVIITPAAGVAVLIGVSLLPDRWLGTKPREMVDRLLRLLRKAYRSLGMAIRIIPRTGPREGIRQGVNP